MTIFQSTSFILGAILLIAVSIGGWFLLDLRKKISLLFGEKNTETKDDLLKELVRRTARAEAKLEEMEPRLKLVEDISKISVQKVGFLRFNPFQDTGGDQSFILTLLDRDHNGVLISSLYTREGARVYAKAIERGKSKHALSEEENRVLEETLAKNKL